jgi:hypothetical protein
MAARKTKRSKTRAKPAQPSMATMERKWRAEADARTLREAAQIRTDAGRRRAAKAQLSRDAREAERAKRKL